MWCVPRAGGEPQVLVNRYLIGYMKEEAGLRLTIQRMSQSHGEESHPIFSTWAESQDEFCIIHHPTSIY